MIHTFGKSEMGQHIAQWDTGTLHILTVPKDYNKPSEVYTYDFCSEPTWPWTVYDGVAHTITWEDSIYEYYQ